MGNDRTRANRKAVYRPDHTDQRQGSILFIAVAMLMGLLLFAIAFARLTSVERTASSNYMLKLRARSIARAGIHRVISELRQHYEKRAYDDARKISDGGRYRPVDEWVYYDRYYRDLPIYSAKNYTMLMPPNGDNTRQTSAEGLRFTRNISFAQRAQIQTSTGLVDADVKLADSAQQEFYVSGAMGQSVSSGLDSFRTKVLDCSSMIHVNGKDRGALRRMLKTLIYMRFRYAHNPPVGTISVANADAIARRVALRRPGGGYLTKEQVGLVMRDSTAGARLTLDQWELIKDDLTCFAWLDRKVILPPLSQIRNGLTSGSISPIGNSAIRDATMNATLELTERAPININTASVAVLTAVFAELEGVVVDHNRSLIQSAGTSTVTSKIVRRISINLDQAEKLALEIVKRRNNNSSTQGAFKGWFEFETWLDTTGSLGLSAEQRDLVKAMVNPNTDLVFSKFGLEGNHMYRWQRTGNRFLPVDTRVIDKSDLTQITTELCFASMGWFEVTSLGQIWDAAEITGGTSGRAILRQTKAEQTVQTVVRVYDVLRLTTQRDFERDRVYTDAKMFLNYTQLPKKGPNHRFDGFTDLADRPSDSNLLYAWAATLTQPEYSNRHVIPSSAATSPSAFALASGANRITIDPEYHVADYDGTIILNGLASIKAQPKDFLVGFARGSMRPIKTRVEQTEKGQANSGSGRGPSYGGRSDDDVRKFFERVGSEKVLNTGTQARTINDQGKRSLLNPGGSFGELFRGSSLTNLGALITEDRENYLVYDGDNLDLRDSTVHFWVKPVKEYYWQGGVSNAVRKISRSKQVLFSWLGGFKSDGLRDGGFEIVRVRQGNVISLKVQMYGLKDRGRFAATEASLFTFPVAFVRSGPGGSETYSPSSLWRPGAWNHVQFSFGIDRVTGRYTGTLIVNTQYMPGGFVGLAGNQGPSALNGVRHAFATGPRPATSVGSRGRMWWIDRLWFDYYYCQLAGGNLVTSTETEDTPVKTIEPDEFGQYLPYPGIKNNNLFRNDQANPEIVVRFEPSSHSPANASISGDSTALKPKTHDSSIYPTNSETPPNPNGTNFWYYPPTQSVRDNKLTIKFYRRFQKRTFTTNTPYTTNQSFCSNYRATNRSEPDQYDAPTRNNPGLHCWNRFPTYNEYTLNECDDCEGCEACDIDGPIFIGAELAYPSSQGSLPIKPLNSGGNIYANTSPSPVRNDVIDTKKVFHFGNIMIDNLYLLGYRVDEHGSDPDANHLVNVPSDRFFDSDVSGLNSTNPNTRGHKPGYKRILTELFARKIRLGTASWTGYPGFNRQAIGELAREQNQNSFTNFNASSNSNQTLLLPNSLSPVTLSILKWDFDVSQPIQYSSNMSQGGNGLDFMDGVMSTRSNSQANLLPTYNPAASANRSDPDRGGRGMYCKNDEDRDCDLSHALILAVDFAPATASNAGTFQTPTLDDVTITYFTVPKIIYTEEGVE